MTLETTVMVPASRQVTLTLPPETPMGPMRLTVLATTPVAETERCNPDTPEFRDVVRQSRETLALLKVWMQERQTHALSEGRTAESAIGEFSNQDQRHEAFRRWRENYELRQPS